MRGRDAGNVPTRKTTALPRTQRRAAEPAPGCPAQGATRSRSVSIRAGPIPETASSSSTDVNGPMLRPVVDDLLRGDRPTPGQRVELIGGRGVQVNRPPAASPGPAAPAAPIARPGAAARHDHLLAVGDGGRQVHGGEIGPSAGAARTGERVGNPRTLPQPVEPRAGAPRRRRRPRPLPPAARRCRVPPARSARGLRGRPRVRPPQQPRPDDEEDEQGAGDEERLAPGEREVGHPSSVATKV